MERKQFGRPVRLLAAVLGTATLTGCACGMLSPCGVEPCEEPAPEVAPAPEPPPPPPPPPSPQPPASKVFFFDFDQATIRSEDVPLLERHARFLVDYPERTIVIEGHADERGPERYNEGLGMKRAQAVFEMLSGRGVAEGRMETKTYGESRPAVPGSDEDAWASNRRAVIIYYE